MGVAACHAGGVDDPADPAGDDHNHSDTPPHSPGDHHSLCIVLVVSRKTPECVFCCVFLQVQK